MLLIMYNVYYKQHYTLTVLYVTYTLLYVILHYNSSTAYICKTFARFILGLIKKFATEFLWVFTTPLMLVNQIGVVVAQD